MSTEESVSEEITALKAKVKEIIGAVNSLKGQLERREISLEEFRERKEKLENELRGILEKISQYKEKSVTKEIKQDAHIADEANKLMFEFQTEFSELISKPKVYLSASVDDHFIFEIDFTNYPQKPKLTSPDKLQKLFEVPLEQKLPILSKWSPQQPGHIVEIFYEIESVLMKIYQAEEVQETDLNQQRLEKILERRKLMTSAEYEQELKNNKKAIDLYHRALKISYELEEFERADKLSKLIAELKNLPPSNEE
jgi:hypothetical protein